MAIGRILAELKAFWKIYVIILTPLILLPLVLAVDGSEAACGYAILIMAVYWLTEALPLAITAILPMILFPMLGLVSASQVSLNYMRDINFVFIGGIMVALAIEKSKLHARMSLKLLKIMGVNPKWLVLGFMISTCFLSMWICNTATTVMMIPVANAVLEQFKVSASTKDSESEQDDHVSIAKEPTTEDFKLIEAGQGAHTCQSLKQGNDAFDICKKNTARVSPDLSACSEYGDVAVIPVSNSSCSGGEREYSARADDSEKNEAPSGNLEKKYSEMSKLFGLAICYSANIGGVGTLTGQSPNLVFAGFVDELWRSNGLESPVTWASWLVFAFPLAAICLVIAWLLLVMFFLGPKNLCCCCVSNQHDPALDVRIKEAVDREYVKLGPWRFDEIASLSCLVTLVFLWFLRDPGFVSGYSVWFVPGFVGDSVPAVLVAVLLFIIPEKRPISGLLCNLANGELPRSVPALLNWPLVARRMAWGPIFIIGAGFAMAQAVQVSGLSRTIAEAMSGLESLPPALVVFLITILVGVLTNITSNAATVSLILPILAPIAEAMQLNPLYLMLPATVSSTMSFSLPVATPPNSVVFTNGYVNVLDMAGVGTILHLLCILVIMIATHSWGMALFDLNTLPWEADFNSTSIN